MEIAPWVDAPESSIFIADNQIDLWCIDLNPAEYSFSNFDTTIYAPDELERASRFRFDRHKRQYLVGRGGLRVILSRYIDRQPADVHFAYGEYGKPELADNVELLEFNLSNSSDLALVAVTKGRKIGADIEFRDRHLWEIDSLAQTVFTPQEINELNQYQPEEKLVQFLSGWTRKEAYLKGVGKGLALPLKDFSVRLKNDIPYPSISVPGWELFSFWSAEDYLSAIAYPSSSARPIYRWFRF